MAGLGALYLSAALLLAACRMGANQAPPAGEPGKSELNDTFPDTPSMDCGSRWSCRYYSYSRLINSLELEWYSRQNCACDELCLLLQDCCPDAPVLRPTPPGHGSGHGDRADDASERASDDGKATVTVESAPSGSASHRKGHPPLQPDRGQSGSDPKSSSPANIGDNNVESHWTHMKTIYRQHSLHKDVFSCVYDRAINDRFQSVSVVTNCPEHYDDPEVTPLCHIITHDDMMTRLPVSGRRSRVLYRNMFCAMCHEEPFLYWKVQVGCDSYDSLPYDVDNTTLQDLLGNDHQCGVTFFPPAQGYGWRQCLGGVRNRCSDNFPVHTPRERYIVESCEDVDDNTQPLVFSFHQRVAFRNLHCALCNHHVLPDISCTASLTGPAGPLNSDHI